MSAEQRQKIAGDLIRGVTMLHAHGVAHLDLKPANLMWTRAGTWKIIDLDGCVPLHRTIEMDNKLVSYSPCYCAPEFASFVRGCAQNDKSAKIVASPLLDAWSVGLILSELIECTPVLLPQWNGMARANGGSREKDAVLTTEQHMEFCEWLATTSCLGIPRSVWQTDKDLGQVIIKLVAPQAHRETLDSVLYSDPYCGGDHGKSSCRGNGREEVSLW